VTKNDKKKKFSGEMRSLKKKPGKRRLWECVELKRRIKRGGGE
jgi:hypothetical protein